MAAIYSGIHLKLKSSQTPWEDKIKLARFAWISSQCLLPNKEQVLLDWCCHALTGWYNKKVEFPQNVLDALWCFFDDLLHSRKLHTFFKQGKSISLRLNMAQVLLDRLQDHEQSGVVVTVGLSTLLSVCQGILTAPPLSSVFTTKYELMVSLLARLVLLACHHSQQLTGLSKSTPLNKSDHESHMDNSLSEPVGDPGHKVLEIDPNKSTPTNDLVSTKLFTVLHHALACYLSVQRQQTNPNRIFALVTNQLFQPMIVLRYWLSSDAQLQITPQMSRDLRTKVDTILQLALFPPEHMSLYQEELTKMDSGKRCSAAGKGPLRPTSVILGELTVQSICEPPLHYAMKSNTVSLLFKLFLESYGAGKGSRNEEQGMLCFYFLATLAGALDVGLDFQKIFLKAENTPKSLSVQGTVCVPERWGLALLSIESLLNNALVFDIYNVAADRIRHEEVQLRFYRSVAEILLRHAQPSIPAWYRCLKVLLSLNHLILEPDLEQFLSSTWINMDCSDIRVLRAQQVTLCCLLQTYTKLRQLPRFFSDLLSVINETSLVQSQPPLLSPEVAASLRTCLLDMPASQTVETCSLLLQSFNKHISLLKLETKGDGMSIDFEVTSDANSSLKMLLLCQLLHSVLFSLKTLDNSSPLPLVKQCQNLMTEMQEAIKKLQEILTKFDRQTKPSVLETPKLSKKKKKVVDSEAPSQLKQNLLEAGLLLRYTWVEIDTLFSIHCSKYASPDCAQQMIECEDQTSDIGVKDIESFLSGKGFCHSIASSPFSSLLHKHILLQHLKKILSDPSALVNASLAALNQAVHLIAAEEEIEKLVHSDQQWDGHMNNVNDGSHLVAHWYLVTSNLPLLLPYIDEKDRKSISRVLVGSVLRTPTQDKNMLSNNLSVSLISQQFLKSHLFPELPSLFSDTIQFLLHSLSNVLRAAQKPGSIAVFPDSDGIDKALIVGAIQKSLTNGEACVALGDTETHDVLSLLQVIEVMNTDGMSSEDMSACFLVLFFMLTSCQKKCVDGNDGGRCEELSTKLLQILNSLSMGTNFPYVLKSIHGGTLLQAVVSNLLHHRAASPEDPESLRLVREMQAFINCLVQLIISRSISVRLNLNQFASYLCGKEVTDQLTEAASSNATANGNAYILTNHIVLAALSTFSLVLTSNLGKGKSLNKLLTQILTQTTSKLGLAVESVLNPDAVVPKSFSVSQAFVVEVLTVMLQSELSLFLIEEDKQTQSISHLTLFQHSSQQILKEVNSAPRPLEFLVSSLSFLSTFYSAVEKTSDKENMEARKDLDDLFVTILSCLQRLLTAPWISDTDHSELESGLQTLLCHLVENCSSDRFRLLLLMIKEGLDTRKLSSGNYREVLTTVILIKLLFCCPLPEDCFKALWHIAPQIISSLVFLMSASSQHASWNLPFTVYVTATVTTLLRQGEGVISNPHHVTMVLGGLQCVPLDRLTPTVYEATFTALHEALFAIIKCHPQVMLKAAPSFLNVFYRLVSSIMQEGKQRKDSDTGSDSAVSLRCAMLVERMYSHIAATSEEFTTLSTFIVAQYVTELQKVTLQPDIKLHLTEGIYMILDLCLETDIKFLMAGLQAGVREVFNDLYSSYTHFHKAQRQGEEKYTV